MTLARSLFTVVFVSSALLDVGCSLISLDDLHSGATTGAGSGGASSSSQSSSTFTSTAASSGQGSTSTGAMTTSSGTGGAASKTYSEEVLADGPIAYYRLAEGSSSSPAVDVIAALDGTYSGTLTVGAASPLQSEPADKAVLFGGGQVLVAHPEVVIAEAPSSFEAWARTTTIDANHRALIDVEWAAATPGQKQGTRLYVTTFLGAPSVLYGRTFEASNQDLSTGYPADGAYHHLVGTYDGTSGLCIYVDGTPTCQTLAKITMTGSGSSAVIGARPFGSSSDSFRGSIDEVAFYDKALSAARVLAHFKAR